MKERSILTWSLSMLRRRRLPITSLSRSTLSSRREELPSNSTKRSKLSMIWKRSGETKTTCILALGRSVDSEDPSSLVDKNRELLLLELSSRTQRSSFWMKPLLLWMSKVKRLYSKLLIERWRVGHQSSLLIVSLLSPSVIVLWSFTRVRL